VAVVAAKNSTLKAFTVAALALPGLLPTAKAAQKTTKPVIDFQYGHYQESDDRIAVDIYQGIIALPISKSLAIQSNWVVDTFSGATPVLTMPNSVAQVISGASGISGVDDSKTVTADEQAVEVMTGASTRETRYGIDLGFNYTLNDFVFSASGSRSEEPDYLSHGYNLGVEWIFNQKFNTLSLGFGQNFDQISPTTRILDEQKTDYHLQLGFSQVVSKESVLKLSSSYTYNDGYLSNPYKKVFIQDLDTNTNLKTGGFSNVYYENRPDKRHQWSASLAYIQYISFLKASVQFDYRYFKDSWDISSHTFEAIYRQPLSKSWELVSRLRYYSQSEAKFYKNFYIQANANNHYSSDYRLAGFGTLAGGIKLTKEWGLASKFTKSIKIELGVEYSTHAADLKLGDQTTASNLSDFNYILCNSSINIKF